jgi:hypothetical protein
VAHLVTRVQMHNEPGTRDRDNDTSDRVDTDPSYIIATLCSSDRQANELEVTWL